MLYIKNAHDKCSLYAYLFKILRDETVSILHGGGQKKCPMDKPTERINIVFSV